MKYFIYTFGCQMNKSDSERIAGFLENRGFLRAQEMQKSDLVILNTCSVRQSAEERVFGLIANLKKLASPPKIAVTGCLSASKNQERLKNQVDLVFKINEPEKILGSKKSFDPFFKITPRYESSHHAYVPIMTGCDNFCTYCVVPYTRGREKSKPSLEILEEIKNLVKKGYKAITLVGQNVNSYGRGLSEKIDFPKLLQKIEKIKGDFWLWFVTSHPKDMREELIKTIARSKRICHYVHLPCQAGSDEILKRMNRGYSREKYLKLIQKIKKAMPDASISTDVIVGFPGETRNQFQETAFLFKKVKFDMAYIARYSPRQETAAFQLKDDVPCQEKIRRQRVLDKLLRKFAYENNKKMIGKTLEVLIESEKKGALFGKTKTFKTVKLNTGKQTKNQRLIGKILLVKIKKASDFCLEGV